MNIGANNQREADIFCVEEIVVPYFNIEITHANDNKAPMVVTVKKAIIWLLLISILAGIFYM